MTNKRENEMVEGIRSNLMAALYNLRYERLDNTDTVDLINAALALLPERKIGMRKLEE